MTLRRIIVCGCRNWADRDQVARNLSVEWALHGGPYGHVVVHGDCPTGADAFAEAWCANVGVQTEKHPANWERDGRAAGPVRNRAMARAGAAVCLAFWDGKSPGTLDMIQTAIRQGIPVSIVPPATERTGA